MQRWQKRTKLLRLCIIKLFFSSFMIQFLSSLVCLQSEEEEPGWLLLTVTGGKGGKDWAGGKSGTGNFARGLRGGKGGKFRGDSLRKFVYGLSRRKKSLGEFELGKYEGKVTGRIRVSSWRRENHWVFLNWFLTRGKSLEKFNYFWTFAGKWFKP